ncbi:MAG: hypothetical protein ABEJ31_13400 [Haloarculaceae archaeon]
MFGSRNGDGLFGSDGEADRPGQCELCRQRQRETVSYGLSVCRRCQRELLP